MTATNSSSNPSTGSQKIALHQKYKSPRGKKTSQGQTLGQNVDQQILQIVSGNFNEKVVRTKYLQLALSAAGAVGACFLSRDQQDLWMPAIHHPTVGRVPERRKFSEEFSELCDQFASSAMIQSQKIQSLDGLTGLFATIRTRNSDPEILLLVVKSQAESVAAIKVIQKVVAAIQLWLNARDSADAEWQVQALGAIIELVSKVENQNNTKKAAEEIANLLANRLGCNTVAVGLFEKNRMQLKAISGVSKIDKGSETSRNYLQTLVESATRKTPGIYPAVDGENNFLLQAHKQLAGATHAEAVYSQPLFSEDEEPIGALVFSGPRPILESGKFSRFNDAAAAPISSVVTVVNKVKQSTLQKTKTYVKRKMSAATRFILLASIVGFILLMFLPVTYRVRCNCLTEPVSRRFAVAPFDGQIVVGHAEAGDIVKSGEILAEMDGRTIRWELSGVTAERKQSLRTREMELSERNIPKTILAELEYDRLVSEEQIWQYKKDHLQIKSPIDGVVLSGSLERAEAASVETGQILFEIGPTKPIRIEVAIPSNEIAQAKVGFDAKVWIDGQEDEPIVGKIKKIHPRSETRDADNVFIAQIEFANEDERLRPGMKGSARIDCEKRSLGWSLFHKPVNYVRSRLTWW